MQNVFAFYCKIFLYFTEELVAFYTKYCRIFFTEEFIAINSIWYAEMMSRLKIAKQTPNFSGYSFVSSLLQKGSIGAIKSGVIRLGSMKLSIKKGQWVVKVWLLINQCIIYEKDESSTEQRAHILWHWRAVLLY